MQGGVKNVKKVCFCCEGLPVCSQTVYDIQRIIPWVKDCKGRKGKKRSDTKHLFSSTQLKRTTTRMEIKEKEEERERKFGKILLGREGGNTKNGTVCSAMPKLGKKK